MDRLPEDTVFALSAHLYSEQQDPAPRALIDKLERALRDVAALPHEASPAVAFARQALAEYRRLNAADRLTSITALVAYLLNVRLDDLMSRARNQHIAFCRQVAMYVCRRVSGASFPTLGEHFHRNHGSVHHACKLVHKRVREDAGFGRVIEKIERDLSAIRVTTAAAS